MTDKHTWHDVVKKCERILGLEGTAKSPLLSNLPNIVRDYKHGISPLSASQPTDAADSASESLDGKYYMEYVSADIVHLRRCR